MHERVAPGGVGDDRMENQFVAAQATVRGRVPPALHLSEFPQPASHHITPLTARNSPTRIASST
jgi:hypothetical protein